MSHDHKLHKLECMIDTLENLKWPNVHANGYDTRHYLDLDVEERDLLLGILRTELICHKIDPALRDAQRMYQYPK